VYGVYPRTDVSDTRIVQKQKDKPPRRGNKTIQLGQMFASISLAFGLFFFIFAAKYYLSVAIVMIGKNKVANRNGNHLNGNGFSKNGNGNNSKRTEHDGGNPLEPLGSIIRSERTSLTKGDVAAKIGERLKSIFLKPVVLGLADLAAFLRSKSALSPEIGSKQENGNGKNGENSNGNNHQPFVSIHLPFYNEKNVADRILNACTSLDYENYEVIVADDSIDETVEILKKWKDHPKVKISHRDSRKGWKGGALNEALKQMDSRAEYVMVFDADFVPPPDIIKQFLPYFGNNTNGNHNGNNGNNHSNGNNGTVSKDDYQRIIEKLEQWYQKHELAVVQGYQWHYLNAGENWLTKGIRAEYSSSYVIERTSQELFGSMKMIAGSVFMIKADIIKKYAWSTSMTEDWELTLRLYLDGYKVSYTPYIQAPAECPSTIPQLTRQRMRWAEGHTFNAKKYFWEVLRSPKISAREKLEFSYYAPYYIQSFIFLIGTFFWFLSETMHQYLPFWTQVFGWSLLLSNLLALPFMGLAGLFLEKNVKRDFTGILSFVVMSYILVPFQAYASLKGLLEKKEGGTWIRTLKTGKITEALTKLRLGRIWRELMPRKRAKAKKRDEIKSPESAEMKHSREDQADSHNEKKRVFREFAKLSSVLSRKPLKGFGTIGLVLLAAMSGIIVAVTILSTTIPEASAIPSNTKWFLYNNGGTSIGSAGTMSETAQSGTTTEDLVGGNTYYWASDITYDLSSADSGTWTFHLVYSSHNYPGGKTITVTVYWSSSPTSLGTNMGSATVSPPSSSPYDIPITVTAPSQSGKYIQLSYYCNAPSNKLLTMKASTSGIGDTYLLVPEYALLALFVAPLLPTFMKRKVSGQTGRRSKSCRAK